jgi:hypothetical protein
MASREGRLRDGGAGVLGCGGVALSLACTSILNCWGILAPSGWTGSGVPGAVGTRGGAGAPPTAYQPLWARGK